MYKVKIKLSELLERRGISRREFARMTDIRHPSINEMCNNETQRLPLDNLAKICETLNVDINEVLELDKDVHKKEPV